MEKEKINFRDVRMNKKAVFFRIGFLVLMYITLGICTRVIPQGQYARTIVDGHTVIDASSFTFLEGDPLPIWKWFTAPIDAILSGSSTTSVLIILSTLLMGGVMIILDESKVLVFVVSWIIKRFGKDKYRLMRILVAVMMLLGSVVSFYDNCGIFIPLCVGVAFAFGWDSLMGIGMSYLPIAMGFAVSTTNPYTIGIPQSIAGLPMYSGILLRFVFLLIMYVIYIIFLSGYARKIDRDFNNSITLDTDKGIRHLFPEKLDEEVLANRQIAKGGIAFVISILVVIFYAIIACFVSALSTFSMYVMMLSLVLGAVISARLAAHTSYKEIGKAFVQGTKVTLPSAIFVFIILGLRQIISSGNILDTLLYYAYNGIKGMNPYIAVFVILGITMAFEFIVSGASSKAFLILPLLIPLGNMVGLTSQTIVQAYSFGDSFSNAFYPTSTMLLIISGVLNMPLSKWYKFTWKLALSVIVYVAIILLFCVAINFGPF